MRESCWSVPLPVPSRLTLRIRVSEGLSCRLRVGVSSAHELEGGVLQSCDVLVEVFEVLGPGQGDGEDTVD